MLKEAIEKIQAMCRPEIREIQGTFYTIGSDGVCRQIEPELHPVETISLSSLDALVKLVKTEAVKTGELLYITVPHHEMVRCFTNPKEELRRGRLYPYDVRAADVPGWNREMKLGFEEAIMALRTRFQESDDTKYALMLLSDITTGNKVTFNDNGVATSIVTKTGVALQSNIPIRPIVNLRPYRTFQEVDQPESPFLIRINERHITFTEADGGMWKLQARRTVAKYLKDRLEQEVQAGQVVVAL